MINPFSTFALGFTWLAIVGISWLGWQLLRQNGRLLLRLDELEKRLNEAEFAADEPEGLPLGTEAPTFDLEDLAGQRKSLAQYRGQPMLLIFFDPACGFCRELAPKLAEFSPSPSLEQKEGERMPQILIISTGDAEKNREFFHEHKLGCPVLLQKQSEIATAYQANGTPAGYLISPEGKIASELAMGAEALLALASGASRGGAAGEDRKVDGNRADRFSQRSLSRSKLKRDGLKAGTPAPDFRLPRLDGRGELSLNDLRGRQVLLVFSSPNCGPCNSLAPELEKFHREQTEREVGRVTPCAPPSNGGTQDGAHGVTRPTFASPAIAVLMISKGEPKENRAKVKEHGLTFPVVLQQQWEISRRYAMFATPVGYLIDEQGIIGEDVAVGVEPILGLMARAAPQEKVEPLLTA